MGIWSRSANGLAMLAAMAVSACSEATDGGAAVVGGDDHLTCAALVGAASTLMATGKVAMDAKLDAGSLVAATTHVNAYAIPQNIPEAEAYKKVNAEKERLLKVIEPDQIMVRARACLPG